MKRVILSFVLALAFFLLLPQSSFAQKAQEQRPRLAVGIHGNTGTPPLLGVSYFFSERIALRGSVGFFPESGSYDARTTPESGGGPPDFDYEGMPYEEVEHDTRWYGGVLAGLYYLPELWRVRPYTGLKTQYVWAHSESNAGLNRTLDRIDAGALTGAELRVFSWLRFSGELGVGYRSGLNRNSAVVPSIGSLESSEFGLMHAGLGIQVRFH